MEEIAMGVIIGFLRGIPQMMVDIQANTKMSDAEKRKYMEQLAGEIHDLNQQVAAYRFKDV